MEKRIDKTTERALEAYPPKMRYVGIDSVKDGRKIDVNKPMRDRYVKAYHQAEKDLELTWVDIKIILDIEIDILRECNSQKELVLKTYPKGEDYYGEILKRFKNMKDGSKG